MGEGQYKKNFPEQNFTQKVDKTKEPWTKMKEEEV